MFFSPCLKFFPGTTVECRRVGYKNGLLGAQREDLLSVTCSRIWDGGWEEVHHLGILAQDGAFTPNLTHSVIAGRVGKAHGFGLLRTTRDQLILRHY